MSVEELEQLAKAALPEGRRPMDYEHGDVYQTFESSVWYDDGDLAAGVASHMDRGVDGRALAAFWAAAHPQAVLDLIRYLRLTEAQAEARVRYFGDGDTVLLTAPADASPEALERSAHGLRQVFLDRGITLTVLVVTEGWNVEGVTDEALAARGLQRLPKEP